jgi:hypothetical protein
MAKRTKGKGRKSSKGRRKAKAPRSKGIPEKVLKSRARRLGKTVGGRKLIGFVKDMY